MTKQKLVLILVMLIVAGNVFAQSGWYWQNPFPQGNFLNAIGKVDSTTIFASSEGNLIKSIDKGESWKLTQVNINGTITKIKFISSLIGFATIDNRILYKTSNGGNNWYKVLDSSSAIGEVKFLNTSDGLILSNVNTIMKTTNGGDNWFTFVNFTVPESYLTDIAFVTQDIIICNYFTNLTLNSYPRNWRTTNGGLNWSITNYGSAGKYNNINFLNQYTGYIVGDNRTFLKTINSGETWTSLNVVLGKTHYKKIEFVTADFWYVDTYEYNTYPTPLPFYSSNSGANWYATPEFPELRYIFFNPSTIINVGNIGNIYKSTNFGLNWTNKLSSYITTDLKSVKSVSDSISFACGAEGKIVKTTNAGVTWYNSQNGISSNSALNQLHFVNSLTGFIVSLNDLYSTSNGGNNWIPKLHTSTEKTFNSVYFLNPLKGFLAGNKLFMKTEDAGANWSSIILDTSISYIGITFIDNSTGFVTTSQRHILYKTTNRGDTWQLITTSPHGYQINFFDENTGIMTGDYGNLWRTTNQGNTWDSIASNVQEKLVSLSLLNNSTGFVTGSYNPVDFLPVLLKTTDKGLTWENIAINYARRPYSVSCLGGYATIVGEGGLIKSTHENSSVFINQNPISSLPKNISLHQNYPNPFNPSTRINYEIKSSGFVSLKVFDLLGKEVALLVNEKRNAGSYAVDFNSSEFNLPSGIYFYTLSAGEFKETRKMVLVK